MTALNGTRRKFNVAAFIDADWWGHMPFVEEITAGSRAEAIQIMEERLGASAVIRGITAQEVGDG